MPDIIVSPNMSLPVPVVSTCPGPDWATNLNSCLSAIDSHNHTSGSGVLIPPSGLDINTDLPMQNNSLIQTESVVFQAQSSLTTLKAVYVSGVDLYYNDGSGNSVRITSGGSVAGSTGTITGLPSGTASASYQAGSGTFQFQSATNTPANISGATVLISEQTTSPNFISLKSPTSLAASYNVVFPAAVPASTKIVQMSSSGVLSAGLAVDNSTLQNSGTVLSVKDGGIDTTQLADDAVTTAKIEDGAVTPAKLAALGQQISSANSGQTVTSTSFVDVTNLTVTITTTGRPVFVGIIPLQEETGPEISMARSADSMTGFIKIVRGGTANVGTFPISMTANGASSMNISHNFGFWTVDPAGAGTQVYKVQAKVNTAASSQAISINGVKLIAYEL